MTEAPLTLDSLDALGVLDTGSYSTSDQGRPSLDRERAY